MLLIITSCIKVNKDVPYVVINNQQDRLNDYIETLKWAIKDSPFSKIVFCDNSNYDFIKIREIIDGLYENAENNDKKLELLSFQGDVNMTIKKGKGYGEGEILEYVFSNSKLIKGEDAFCKITGRLKVHNIMRVNFDRNNLFVYNPAFGFFDTRFYKVEKSFFDSCLKNEYKNVDDRNNYFLEHAYYDAMKKSGRKVYEFSVEPIIIGKSGSNGTIYNLQKVSKSKEIIKCILKTSCLYNTFMGRYCLCLFYKLKSKAGKIVHERE